MKAMRGCFITFLSLAVVPFLMFFSSASAVRAQGRPDIQTLASFIESIRENDINAVSNSLAADTNLARALYYGRLPLHVAASKGNAEIVALLLKHGADINAPGDTFETSGHRLTALDAAIWYGHSNVCLQLLQAGADPNRLGGHEGAALHFAFTYKRKEMVGWLLAHGADPFLEGGSPYQKSTPLETAINFGAGEFVPVLLREGRVKSGPAKSGAQLLKDGVLPPLKDQAARILAARGSAMLSAAAQRGQVEAVEALLDAGVRADKANENGIPLPQSVSLAEAAASKAKDFPEARWARIRELLEKNGAMFDAFAATGWGDLAAARRLAVASTAVVQGRDHEGATPLHWSVKSDRLPMTSFWLEAGAAPAATNFAGQTPLHLAAGMGLTEHLKLLLAAHAPTTARDTNGLSPLDVAVKAQQTESIRLLLGKEPAGARPERGMAQSIHKVAEAGNLAALAALATDTDKLESRNELGLTPLHVAVRSGHLAAAALLVDRGADVNARDPEGNTLLHQILQNQFFIHDRPPTNWLSRVTDDKQRQNYTRFLMVGQYEQGPDAVLQAASFLLASGIDVAATNRAGKTAIQLAADEEATMHAMIFDEERTELLKLLSGSGGNVSQADDEGNTPLHLAIADINSDRADSLIEAGANVNATNHLGRTPLHRAVEHLGHWGSYEDTEDACPFRSLFKHGANVNAQDNEGLTPLHVLAQSDSAFKRQAVKALLAAGADSKIVDNHKRTVAHAFLTGEWPGGEAGQCLSMLAAHDADLSAADDQGQTLLHYLARLHEHSPLFFITGITNLLGGTNVDIMARDAAGDTPLHIAARSGTSDVFDWLVKRGANLDATNNLGETPRVLAARNKDPFTRFNFNTDTDIFRAIQQGKLDSVAALIKADPALVNDTSRFGQTPLRTAVISHRTNIVEFLEQHGAQWDAATAVLAGRAQPLREILYRDPGAITNTVFGKGLLHHAAVNGDITLIQILLNAGADVRVPDDWGLSALGCARLRQQPAAVTELLRGHGAAENIFDAVYNGDTELASTLLADNKSLVQATNRSGAPVVEVAASRGPVDVLRLLLDKGAKAESANPRTARTPLHFAALGNQADVAELLIRRGAAVNAGDNQGFQPLHLAAANGATDAAAVLLRHKADPNTRTMAAKEAPFPPMGPDRGVSFTASTPLHLAAKFGQTNMISLLLKSGAAINATNAAGRTPLDLAGPAPMGFEIFWMQRNLGLAGDPSGAAVPSQGNPMASLMERQRAGAALIEQAGGQRSPNARPGFGPPGY